MAPADGFGAGDGDAARHCVHHQAITAALTNAAPPARGSNALVRAARFVSRYHRANQVFVMQQAARKHSYDVNDDEREHGVGEPPMRLAKPKTSLLRQVRA